MKYTPVACVLSAKNDPCDVGVTYESESKEHTPYSLLRCMMFLGHSHSYKIKT